MHNLPIKKYIIYLIIFLGLLIYFIWNSSWHLPSQLIIKGRVQLPAEVQVNWDSGSGFNDMESADLVFGNPVKTNVRSGVVKIRRIGRSHPAARSNDVWIKAVKRSEDDRPMPLTSFASQEDVELTADGDLHLKKDGTMLTVPAGKDHTVIDFAMNDYSGFVEIDLDGDKRLYELYAEQPQDRRVERSNEIFAPGDFIAKMSLPQYDIHHLQIKAKEGLQTFRIDSITILSQKGEMILPVQGGEIFSDIYFLKVPRNTKQFFHLFLFTQQVCFAALCTYFLMSLWRFVQSRGGVKLILIGEKRIIFWLMFSVSSICFSLWLLAYWPGHLTSDSIHIWWAAKNPEYFLHEHPFVNILYYRFLQQIWNHFAVVGLFQIVATSFLGSYIFYSVYKNKLPFVLIIPFYLWFITSVPIGLYNITLWKDVPFALLVVFWAYYFVRMRLNKGHRFYNEPRIGFLTLLLLLLSVSLFRYNGLIYLILIPFGIAVYQRASLKKIVVVFLVVFLITSAGILSTGIIAKSDFVLGLTKKFAIVLWNANIFTTMNNIVVQYPHILEDQNKYTWYRDDGVVVWHNTFLKKKNYHIFVKYYDYRPKSDAIFHLLNGVLKSSHASPYVWFTWNPFYLLYLFLLGIFYKWFPLVSAYGYVLLTQAFFLLLFLMGIHGSPDFDWRYNYYLFLAGFFLIPLIMLDIKGTWQRHLMR